MLKDKTLELVNEARSQGQTIDQIANGCGLGIHWLNSFTFRKQTDYGSTKIERLYNYLSKTPLKY